VFPTEPLMLQFSATGTTHPKLAAGAQVIGGGLLCRRDGRPSREDRLLRDVFRRRQVLGRLQYGLCEPVPDRGLPRLLDLGIHGTVMQLNLPDRGELPEARRRTRNTLREQLARDDQPLARAIRYGLGCTAGANGHPVPAASVPTSCRSPVPAATRARSRFAKTRSVSRLIASLVDFFIIV
jgi:hypothetical protein